MGDDETEQDPNVLLFESMEGSEFDAIEWVNRLVGSVVAEPGGGGQDEDDVLLNTVSVNVPWDPLLRLLKPGCGQLLTVSVPHVSVLCDGFYPACLQVSAPPAPGLVTLSVLRLLAGLTVQ